MTWQDEFRMIPYKIIYFDKKNKKKYYFNICISKHIRKTIVIIFFNTLLGNVSKYIKIIIFYFKKLFLILKH
jgi:mRNA deadenylase 3'-5' endonuclease subunit Ccr4